MNLFDRLQLLRQTNTHLVFTVPLDAFEIRRTEKVDNKNK